MLGHTLRACFIQLFPVNKKSLALNRREPLPKIYNPWQSLPVLAHHQKYLGTQLKHPGTILGPVRHWFRIHDEYLAGRYIVFRLLNDHSISTGHMEEASLCFPRCGTLNQADLESFNQANQLQFQVKPGLEHRFSGCDTLTIGIEVLISKCSFAVPYWHSVYYPGYPALAPWELNATRTRLLCYIGGLQRGNARARILHEMESFRDQSGKQLFYSFVIKSNDWNELFMRIWEMYATSIFSWQPEGDTETRRAFYDSWMLGCIPVISRSTACTYSGLFGGQLFHAIEDIVIVLEDTDMRNGARIIHQLIKITEGELKLRRERMAELALSMQWGWSDIGNSTDALKTALTAFTS